MFRVSGKVQGGIMTERWYDGVWIGKTSLSDEHLVMKEDGMVVRARAVREMDGDVTLATLDKLRCLPHDPTGTMKPVSQAPRAELFPEDSRQEGEHRFAPKRVHLTKAVIEKFGASPGCNKCPAIYRNASTHGVVPQTFGGSYGQG